MDQTDRTKMHIVKGGGENTPGPTEPAHMGDFARNRIRMLQAERSSVLAKIEALMQRDEELVAQIERHQQILGHTAVNLIVINGGKES